MKKTQADITCYCGRGPYRVTVNAPVTCQCGITLHIQPRRGFWNGKVWGEVSNQNKYSQVYKDIQRGESKLYAKWVEE